LADEGGTRTFAAIFESGDETMSSLKAFAQEQKLTAASFTAIGAFQKATLAYFDWETKKYLDIPVDEQVEALTLLGCVALGDDGPKLHAHVVLGKRDGSTVGGHLKEAIVRPTLELILTESPAHLRRRYDAETGLSLIEI
jgi:predicted DNA-binding protein with PD1-like motif